MKRMLLKSLVIGIVCGCFLTCTIGSMALAQAAKAPAEKQAVKAEKMPAKSAAMKSEKVKAVQEGLNKAGAKVKVDGILGKETRAALKKFQKDSGLKVTGKADEATLAKLGVK